MNTDFIGKAYVRLTEAHENYDIAIFGQLGFIRVNNCLHVKLLCSLKERSPYSQRAA